MAHVRTNPFNQIDYMFCWDSFDSAYQSNNGRRKRMNGNWSIARRESNKTHSNAGLFSAIFPTIESELLFIYIVRAFE